MALATSTNRPAAPDDLLPALHEEIARLPEKYRLAVVHCDLEGQTQAQAAGQLHWNKRTLQHRLAAGRARLKRRLARRGLAPDGATLGAVLLREARAAVPAAWREATVRAALATVDHTVTVGVVSAAGKALAQEVLKVMLIRKLTLGSATLLAVCLIGWGTSAALVALGQEGLRGATSPRVAAVGPAANTAVPQPKPASARTDDTFPIRGRVLDPDGKPVAGAEIYVRPLDLATSKSLPTHQSGRVTASDADGRFRFELDKASSDSPYQDDPAWHRAQIAARAPGLGPAWVEAGSLLKGGEATLRLASDDVPISGRVVDTQGRPVAEVMVAARGLWMAGEGADKDAWIASGRMNFAQAASSYNGDLTWLGKRGTWTTDRDGRFEIRGVGRDRIVHLEFQSPVLAKTVVFAMARASQASPKSLPQRDMLVGAIFEHIVGPTKPITGVVRLKATGKRLAGVEVVGKGPATSTRVSTRTDAEGRFRLVGLPKGGSYEVGAEPRQGIDPFLRATITLTDTEGLKPIETALELPKGVVIIGRMIDSATGRVVRAKQVLSFKVPGNPNEGGVQTTDLIGSPTDPIFRITVPPGEGMIVGIVPGKNLPYNRARLRPTDKGKGIGGIGDGETSEIPLNSYHAYKILNIPADAESIAVDLELTRGDTRKGRLVGPDGKPVIGAVWTGYTDYIGQAKTLAGDTFELLGLTPGRPREVIFAHKDLRLVGWLVIRGEDLKSDVPLVVTLHRAGSIKGRLVDEDGLPLAGAVLFVQTHYPESQGRQTGWGSVWPDGESATSSVDGRFLIYGLKPGLKSIIYVYSEGPAHQRLDAGDLFRNITIQPGEIRDVGDVKVKAQPE
jgi:protocatechuate 3,4-dioxygenase beta subunit